MISSEISPLLVTDRIVSYINASFAGRKEREPGPREPPPPAPLPPPPPPPLRPDEGVREERGC